MAPAPEGLDDAHTPAAARTGLKRIGRFYRFGRFRRRRCGQELADASDAGLASAAGEQAIMPNAVKAAWQDMQQVKTLRYREANIQSYSDGVWQMRTSE